MSDLITVIIPVYNTEKYLLSCVESVLNQSYQNFEIIIVDDGSTDNSLDICNSLKERDSRIQVFHKENKGLADTRNVGLKYATGDFISFLDSDDMLEENSYEYCVNEMNRFHADACYFGRKTYADNGKSTVNSNIPKKLLFKDEEIKKDFAKYYFGWFQSEQEKPYIKESSCCALYRSHIIKEYGIQFLSERLYLSEDAFFNLDICRHARCTMIIPKDFYYYRYNPNSLTTKYDKKRFEKVLGYYHKLQEYSLYFPELQDRKQRIDYKLFALARGIIKKEIEGSSLKEYTRVLTTMTEIMKNSDLNCAIEEINMDTVDRNTKIFISWMKKRQYIRMYLFYKFRKVFS